MSENRYPNLANPVKQAVLRSAVLLKRSQCYTRSRYEWSKSTAKPDHGTSSPTGTHALSTISFWLFSGFHCSCPGLSPSMCPLLQSIPLLSVHFLPALSTLISVNLQLCVLSITQKFKNIYKVFQPAAGAEASLPITTTVSISA